MRFRFRIDTVMPPSTLDAPAKAAWPPLVTANGHCVRRERSTTTETSEEEDGENMQRGWTRAWMEDQYDPVKLA